MPEYDIVSLAVLKGWLGITGTDDDTVLEALIDRLTAVMETEFQWYFGPPRERVEVLCGTGTPKLYLGWPYYTGESGDTSAAAILRPSSKARAMRSRGIVSPSMLISLIRVRVTSESLFLRLKRTPPFSGVRLPKV